MTEYGKIKQASVQKCPVFSCLIWLGWICERFANQISQTVQRCYFSANVRVVFHTKPILTSIRKDVLPPHHDSHLIVLFRCSWGSCFIGRTNQSLDARIKHVPTKVCNFTGGLTDNLRNIYRSSVAGLLINNCDCTENLIVDLFLILSKSHSSFHILSERLSLCKQRECLQGLNIISI